MTLGAVCVCVFGGLQKLLGEVKKKFVKEGRKLKIQKEKETVKEGKHSLKETRRLEFPFLFFFLFFSVRVILSVWG